MQASGAQVAPLAYPIPQALLKSWDELSSEFAANNPNYRLLLQAANRRRNDMLAGSIR